MDEDLKLEHTKYTYCIYGMANCYKKQVDNENFFFERRDYLDYRDYLKNLTCCDPQSCDDLAYQYQKLYDKCNSVYSRTGLIDITDKKMLSEQGNLCQVDRKRMNDISEMRRKFAEKSEKKRSEKLRKAKSLYTKKVKQQKYPNYFISELPSIEEEGSLVEETTPGSPVQNIIGNKHDPLVRGFLDTTMSRKRASSRKRPSSRKKSPSVKKATPKKDSPNKRLLTGSPNKSPNKSPSNQSPTRSHGGKTRRKN